MSMPGRDGTGPGGIGSMAGRTAGFGAGVCAPGYANPVGGRGFGMRFGRGRGFGGQGAGFMGGGRGRRNRFCAMGLPGWIRFGGNTAPFHDLDPEMKRQVLKNQAEVLQAEMDNIKNRLDEMNLSKGAY